MKPLDCWPLSSREQLVGLFTDIDDTLTSDGRITSDALHALLELQRAGLMVVPITGRPVGWSLPFAAAWPVDALVAENGAVALLPDGRRLYMQDADTRAANFAAMQRVASRVLAEVPGAALSRDSHGRETDIAFDHSEFNSMPQEQIDAVVELLRLEGMSATVSSIHINAWFGTHNKWAGAEWVLRELTGRCLSDEIDNWAFVGDSTNDQAMFERFPHSIGVANIRRFERQLRCLPTYIAPSERGAGFAEAAIKALEGARERSLRAAWSRCGWSSGPAEWRLLDYVRARYSEPHRRYHTLRHLHELLMELQLCAQQVADERAVLLAIFFHDIEYETAEPALRASNEERSAQTFRRECAELLCGEPLLVDTVCGYILATKLHSPEAGLGADAQLFLDLDMSILGQPQRRYDEYAADIRAEYCSLDDGCFAAARAAALRGFLQRPIFGTPRLRDRYEASARDNIARELAALMPGRGAA